MFDYRLEILNNFDYLLNNEALDLDFVLRQIKHSSLNGIYIDKIIVRLFIKIYLNIFDDTESALKFLKRIILSEKKIQNIYE